MPRRRYEDFLYKKKDVYYFTRLFKWLLSVEHPVWNIQIPGKAILHIYQTTVVRIASCAVTYLYPRSLATASYVMNPLATLTPFARAILS